eukprot:904127-Heterocapsa_arctica.AAC.1
MCCSIPLSGRLYEDDEDEDDEDLKSSIVGNTCVTLFWTIVGPLLKQHVEALCIRVLYLLAAS